MIIKFEDLLEWDTEVLKNAQKWDFNGTNINKVKGESPKYTMIDWSSVDASAVILDNIDKDVIWDYCCDGMHVNNKEVLLKMMKYIDNESEEYLWGNVVDDKRIISHELYCAQTYDENFYLWWKTIKHYL